MTHEPSARPPAAIPLPTILHGQASPQIEEQVRRFVFSIPAVYESWLRRRTSRHTRRSYDQDVMCFVRSYLHLAWPEDAAKLLRVSVRRTATRSGWSDADWVSTRRISEFF